jgi:hypothetical protein
MYNTKTDELFEYITRFIDDFKPTQIPDDTNFWLVRTKGGRLYNDFCIKNFVALGWNIIDRNSLTDELNEDQETDLKNNIGTYYKDNKRPGYPLNQSRTFMYEMHPGDFVIIPGLDDKPVMFGMLINYYEEATCDYEKEKTFLDDLPPVGEPADCPYKKRWEVKWLKSKKTEELNPHLGRLFASSHGLSKANDYSDYILSSIFDFYSWNGNYNGVFRVKQQQQIKSRDLSGFIYNVDRLSEIIIKKETSIKTNLNSPGDIILSIGDNISNIGEVAKYFWWAFFISSDISFGPFTVKGIIPMIHGYLSNKKSKSEQNAEIERIEAETALLHAKANKENAIADKIKAETELLSSKTYEIASECHQCARKLEIDTNKTIEENITTTKISNLDGQKTQQ